MTVEQQGATSNADDLNRQLNARAAIDGTYATTLMTPTAFAAAQASNGLIQGKIYYVGGVAYMATSNSTYTSLDGDSLAYSDETIVIVGASTCARSTCLQAVTLSTIQVKSGVLKCSTGAQITLNVGDVIRMANSANPQIEGRFRVTSQVTPGSGGGTDLVATVMDGLVLPDTKLGSISTGECYVLMLQHWSSAAGYPALLQLALGGRVRCVTIGTGGTQVSDWNNPYRQAQIAAVIKAECPGGRAGLIIIDPGLIGNAINNGNYSAAATLSDLSTFIQFLRPYGRAIAACTSSAVSSENAITPTKVAANTAAFAAGARVAVGLTQFTHLYPALRVIPIFAAEIVNYGATSTDITNGYAPFRTKNDDGVHNLWGGIQSWATQMAWYIRDLFPFEPDFAPGQPFNIISSPTTDFGGKTVQNLVDGSLYGTVAVTSTVPNSYSAATANLNGMTVAGVVTPNFGHGGSDWIATLTSGGNTAVSGTQVSQIYTGNSNTLLTQLNAAVNQGVPIDVWWDCGIYGFNELSLTFVEVVLEVDINDGRGFVPLASGFSTMGQFQASAATYSDSTKGAQDYGFDGIVRFPRFTIPGGSVYVAARVRTSAKPKTSVDPGVVNLRQGTRSAIVAYN